MSSTIRVACLRIPKFPIGAVWLEGEPPPASHPPAPSPGPAELHWDQRARALASKDRVVLASTAAATLGVRHGLSLAAARALSADLDIRPWDSRAVGRAVQQVTASCLSLSPQVTPAQPGLWWIGAHGLEGHGGERALVRTLLAEARRWHPDARVAVASSCIAASVATWLRGAGRIVPPGGDGALLAHAPLTLIPMDAELRDTFAALGLTRAGQLASLDAGSVEQRFGPAGLAAWHLARGDDHRRPTLAQPLPDDTTAIELSPSAETLEPVLFLVRAALGRLIAQVADDGMAVAALEVELVLDVAPSRSVMRRVALAVPLARLEPLFGQCRAMLEDWVLEAPVRGVLVRVLERARPTGEQGDLLRTGWRDPAAAEAAFARLRAALGPGAVVRPVAHDAHAPERRGAWQEEGTVPSPRKEPADAALLRLLPAPEPIELTTDGREFTWRGQQWPIAERNHLERLSGDWWAASPYARDYASWTSQGTSFVVFHSDGTWKLQGWHD